MRYTRDLATGTDRHGMDKRVNQHHPPVHARQLGEDDHSSVLCSVARCNVSPLRGRFCKEHTPRFETDPYALPKLDLELRAEASWVGGGKKRKELNPLSAAELGYRLADIRNRRGLTARDVAEKVNLRPATIRRIEQGKGSTVATLLALMALYRPNPAQLFRGEE